MFRTIGQYLDAMVLIAVGLAGYIAAPGLAKSATQGPEVARKVAVARWSASMVLVGGVGLLVLHILGIW